IVTSTAGVSGYNPQTGKENWSWKWTFGKEELRTVASSVTTDGLVFATSGSGGGERHAVAVRIGERGDVSNANLAWGEKEGLPYVPCMLTQGEHLYWINDRGVAGCTVAKTGKMVWTERLGGGFTASPILVHGNIYAAGEDGTVYVFPAAPTFKLLAKNTVGEG